LNHAPNATDVLTVVAPRDFENCNPRDTQIADPFLLDEYLSGTVPGWFIHLANFRLTYIVTQAFKIKDERQHLLRNDRYGSSPLYNRMSWNPAPVLDKRCFAALANFRQELSGRGIRLVVATVPVMPSWRAQFDPDGRMLSQWIDEIRASLGGNALLIDGRGLSLPDERFADPVHLLWPEGADYSDFIAGMLKIGS
jgi:hypothetical protein